MQWEVFSILWESHSIKKNKPQNSWGLFGGPTGYQPLGTQRWRKLFLLERVGGGRDRGGGWGRRQAINSQIAWQMQNGKCYPEEWTETRAIQQTLLWKSCSWGRPCKWSWSRGLQETFGRSVHPLLLRGVPNPGSFPWLLLPSCPCTLCLPCLISLSNFRGYSSLGHRISFIKTLKWKHSLLWPHPTVLASPSQVLLGYSKLDTCSQSTTTNVLLLSFARGVPFS